MLLDDNENANGVSLKARVACGVAACGRAPLRYDANLGNGVYRRTTTPTFAKMLHLRTG